MFSDILILSDLDGTLLDSNGNMPPRNRAAILRFMEKGGRFSLATGRLKEAIFQFLDTVPINVPAVVSNGSVIYDYAQKKVVHHRALPTAAATELVYDVRRFFPQCGMEICVHDGVYIAQDTPRVHRHLAKVHAREFTGPLEQLETPWYNMIIFCEDDMPRLRGFIAERYAGRLVSQESLPGFCEVLAPEANKGALALDLCDMLGVRRENLYVLGDGPNDLELLRCTENAFAPANACAEALALCRGRLPSCDEGAAAALIEQLEAARA